MTVSHELRTPLTAIYGWARMLSTGQIRDAQRPRAIDAIERNAAALQQLVNDLLDVSRVVSGKLRLDVDTVSLPDVVGAAIDTIRPAAHAKNIRLVTTAGDGDLVVSGDAGRLQQVIWNLLSNAVRFTPAGGRIEIAMARVADAIEVVVRDTGPRRRPGVSPACVRALPPGRRRHDPRARRSRPRARDRPASGGAARRHRRGVPTTLRRRVRRFASCCPRGRGRAARSTAQSLWPRTSERPACPTRIDGVRVLVTDDDMNARELLAVILENAGAEVRAAASAEDALMILQTWTPEVVLSDIEMPGEDGYGLIEKARR